MWVDQEWRGRRRRREGICPSEVTGEGNPLSRRRPAGKPWQNAFGGLSLSSRGEPQNVGSIARMATIFHHRITGNLIPMCPLHA